MVADLAAPAFRFVAIGAAMFAFGRLAFSAFADIPSPPPRLAAAIGLAASGGAAVIWAANLFGPDVTGEKLAHLFTATFIGKAWLFHLAAAAIFAVCTIMRTPRPRVLLLLATASLASFAPIGHAAAADGADRSIRILLQSLHLLGAGFWIGALPLLVRQLNAGDDAAARAVGAFTKYASVAVAVLIAAAIANLGYLTNGEPISFATTYGQTLLAKGGLVAAAILLAALNRFWMTPRRRFGAIARIAAIEIALLVAVVGVGVLLASEAPWR